MRWIPKHAKPREWSGPVRVTAVAAGACLFVGAVAGIWATLGRSDQSSALDAPGPTLSTARSAPPSTTGPSPSTSAPAAPSNTPTGAVYPVSIDIPAIKVHTTLQKLTLDASGSLEPPTNLTQAGWYTGGPVPGQNGPAVIAGHVDSVSGPAVFFDLKSLRPGDTITVALSSGASVVFRATSVSRYPKNEFPTEAVYGARPDPELRLITCGGGFSGGHYLDNVVVYAAENTPASG